MKEEKKVKFITCIKVDNEGITKATIADTLESWQKEVGGYIEIVNLGDNYILVCDDEGKIKNKSITLALYKKGTLEVIVGTCFILKYNRWGKFTSLNSKEIQYLMQNPKFRIMRILDLTE